MKKTKKQSDTKYFTHHEVIRSQTANDNFSNKRLCTRMGGAKRFTQ
ncbi:MULTISPECIES: hypothetical protein [Vibrio]|nr:MULTISPECIES: hypothetical protein [Vibrio]AGU96248.1 hypothetical protein M892_04315 [Vibrio campbellii ATCC BAA-1116]MBT0139121.1 hypothetical protein [Vibrio campbellii]MBT0143828.1 hypothetical protein [Vibrio campbellii]MBT0157888.1 hypothetical protein [Vibrio campbellii]MBT0165253.1 hypothetical protein [Vibrio campbellii]